MNLWIVATIFVGVLVIAGFAVVNALPEGKIASTETQNSCSSCANSCTKESNCGLATCGAVQGGNCGCKG